MRRETRAAMMFGAATVSGENEMGSLLSLTLTRCSEPRYRFEPGSSSSKEREN